MIHEKKLKKFTLFIFAQTFKNHFHTNFLAKPHFFSTFFKIFKFL